MSCYLMFYVTLVVGGRGAETPVLLLDTLSCCWRTGHGDHRPTIVSKAIHSPLPRGGESRVSGAEEGPLLKDGARRPPSYYSLRHEKTAAASQQLRFKKHIIYFYFIKIVVTFLISPPTHHSGWALTPSHQK